MKYNDEEVLQYIKDENVKFIRLAFCDIYGKQKNIAIMSTELERAFKYGINIDASSIEGFKDETHSDLLLFPKSDTICILPWRPDQGRVVRMFCKICYPDGTPFECDSRQILINAINEAKKQNLYFNFGAEQEFYLFELDENSKPTNIPHDEAGYMDIAPDDKGENIRREICLILEQMGISPESSHHESGPGQNEIDFRYSDPLTIADNVITFQNIVKTVANSNGLYASFNPKPLKEKAGNGFHINVSLESEHLEDTRQYIISGLVNHIQEMTLFLNRTDESYKRLGIQKAPSDIAWGEGNRNYLIRLPFMPSIYQRVELRSPDPLCNPYIAFALIIYATLEAINQTNIKLYSQDTVLGTLPETKVQAINQANKSPFIQKYLPQAIIASYIK